MNFHAITHDDISNGNGLRVVLWVSGCEHRCPGCHNPETWDCDGGNPLTEWEEAELWDWLSKPFTEGLTFSGGDPLFCHNRSEIGRLARKAKHLFPDKTIWLYTGYTLCQDNDKNFYFADEVASLEPFSVDFLEVIDVIVDGRFSLDQRTRDLIEENDVIFRGSSNQRYIDMARSFKEKKIICLSEREDI